MVVFVNEKNEIKDVGSTKQIGLKALVIDDKGNPFEGWSIAKICCYRVNVVNDMVVEFSPYVNSIIIEQLDRLSVIDEANASDISDNRLGIVETFEIADENTSDITDLRNAIEEIYEMLEE